jgi:hypothetical protein
MEQEDQEATVHTEIPETERARAISSDAREDLHAPDDEDIEVNFTEAPRPWRVAKSLLTLRNQVNAKYPGRSKASDGTIGDPAHQSRASDHNPWIVNAGVGVVTGLDITHDPAHGCDSGVIAEALRASKDSRIKYVISNARIASSTAKPGVAAWAWRPYSGSNPHNHHCHVSVQTDAARYDSTASWTLPS